MPLLGPNCYGYINALDGIALWPDQHGCRRVERGVGLITQSSNIALNLTMQRRGLPLAYVVTSGNQAQQGFAAIGRALLEDPRVTALGLHVEGFGDVRAFERLAAVAAASGKPLVVLKSGRSAAARRATLSHTASLAGSDAGAHALLRRLGVARVDTPTALLETLKLLHVHGPSLGCLANGDGVAPPCGAPRVDELFGRGGRHWSPTPSLDGTTRTVCDGRHREARSGRRSAGCSGARPIATPRPAAARRGDARRARRCARPTRRARQPARLRHRHLARRGGARDGLRRHGRTATSTSSLLVLDLPRGDTLRPAGTGSAPCPGARTRRASGHRPVRARLVPAGEPSGGPRRTPARCRRDPTARHRRRTRGDRCGEHDRHARRLGRLRAGAASGRGREARRPGAHGDGRLERNGAPRRAPGSRRARRQGRARGAHGLDVPPVRTRGGRGSRRRRRPRARLPPSC